MRFLLVTDLHYTDKPAGSDNRYHALSLDKFRTAVENYYDGCAFVACLGDIADSIDGCKPQTQCLAEVREMIDGFGVPFYPTFGNHDTALDKNEFMRIIGMPGRYYSFESSGYLFLMLDSCMNSKDIPYPESEIKWAECYVDDEQLSWMRGKIAKSDLPVVVMTHALFEGDEDHTIKNADEIKDILFEFEDKIAALFCGHYHFGLNSKIGSIPYVVFKALCMGEKLTCAVVEIEDSLVKVTGYGDESTIQIKKEK